VYVCDSEECHYAVNYECCVQKDKEIRVLTTLFPDFDEKWYCHHCIGGVPGLIKEPIAAFKELTKKKPKASKSSKKESSQQRPTKRVRN
jgi:hypothetical protein